RQRHLSVTLIEPCFDNLSDIFRRHDIPLRPLSDEWLESPNDAFEHALGELRTDAICLVTPNNPTGRTLSEENLRSLVRFCKHRRALLILENCFPAYIPRHLVYDHHRHLLLPHN